MKLYLVQRANEGYDVLNGALVRAKNEQEARRMVAEKHRDEGYDTWFKPSTRCSEVSKKGTAEVLLCDSTNG